MKILYLHGLLSSNESDKAAYLREQGHQLFNPKLAYKGKQNALFDELEELIVENKIETIVGSSMGGFLAFHLGNKLNIKALLLNPSLQSTSPYKPKLKPYFNKKIEHTVLIGNEDKTVLPQITLDYLEKNEVKCKVYFGEHAHRTPLEVFRLYANNFLDKIK